MLGLEEIQSIRNMYYRQKMTISEICANTRRDYRTVRKYLDMTDFNEPVPRAGSGSDISPKFRIIP